MSKEMTVRTRQWRDSTQQSSSGKQGSDKVEYLEVAEEGHYTGRQAEFEMGELFHKKPLRTDHRLYTKGVAGERQVEQGKDSELPRSSSKQGNNKAIMEEEKEVGLEDYSTDRV